MTAVEARIREVLRDAGAAGWVHATALGGTREVCVGADDRVVMASVYKLPLLVSLCQAFDAGLLDPLATVRIVPADCTPGPTGLSAFFDPVTLTWRDLALSMITVSDNAAADVILGAVGLPAVEQTLADLGLTETRIIGGTADLHASVVRDTGAASAVEAFRILGDNDEARPVSAYDAAFTSATTARDMTRLLGLIWSGSVASPARCEFIRLVLHRQIWPHRIRAGFPATGVLIGGKTGTIGAVRNEVAVVEFTGEAPIAVAVFTQAARADAALPLVDAAIAECARLAVTDLRTGRL